MIVFFAVSVIVIELLKSEIMGRLKIVIREATLV
jgi:hypothetical protein